MKKVLTLITASLLFAATSNAKTTITIKNSPVDTLKKGKNYFILSKTKDIQNIIVSKSKKSTKQQLKVHFGLPTAVPVTNTVFSSTLVVEKKYKPEDAEAFVFDKIKIIKGKYTDVVTTKETYTRNLFTFTDLEFPIRLQLISRDQMVDLELTEAGDWDINIELKNN